MTWEMFAVLVGTAAVALLVGAAIGYWTAAKDRGER